MNIKRGDIVYISKIDNSVLGKNVQSSSNRPYVVISNNINNEKGPTVTVACLSTKINKIKYPMHILLKKEKYKKLTSDSLVFTEQIVTINKDLIVEKIGHLDKKDKIELNKALKIQILEDYPQKEKKGERNEKRNSNRTKRFSNTIKTKNKRSSKKH